MFVQLAEQHFGAGLRLLLTDPKGPQRLGHHVQGGHTGNNPQDLADLPQNLPAQGNDLARGSLHQILIANAYFSGMRQVIAVDNAQQR